LHEANVNQFAARTVLAFVCELFAQRSAELFAPVPGSSSSQSNSETKEVSKDTKPNKQLKFADEGAPLTRVNLLDSFRARKQNPGTRSATLLHCTSALNPSQIAHAAALIDSSTLVCSYFAIVLIFTALISMSCAFSPLVVFRLKNL
jgi:hypothetical protein